MKPGKETPVLPGMTFLLAILISIVSMIGLLTDGFYAKETFTWQLQAVGQDEIDLYLITPLLFVTGVNFWRKSNTLSLLWAGILLYVIYTFTIYCFDIHFTFLFPIYCVILGISCYSFLWFIYRQIRYPANHQPKGKYLTKTTGGYLISVSVLFYLLWLSDIFRAITRDRIPASVADSGLPTNPVHVLDISVLLPALFLTGFFLLKRKPLAFVFANVLLCFFIVMDITIAWLAIKMNRAGIASGPWLTIAMSILAFISLVLFGLNVKNVDTKKLSAGPTGHERLQGAG